MQKNKTIHSVSQVGEFKTSSELHLRGEDITILKSCFHKNIQT